MKVKLRVVGIQFSKDVTVEKKKPTIEDVMLALAVESKTSNSLRHQMELFKQQVPISRPERALAVVGKLPLGCIRLPTVR